MSEIKKNQEVTEEQTCNCEAYKAELAQLKEQLNQVLETNKQYEQAYNELSMKYQRLYAILGNTIDFTLGMK